MTNLKRLNEILITCNNHVNHNPYLNEGMDRIIGYPIGKRKLTQRRVGKQIRIG